MEAGCVMSEIEADKAPVMAISAVRIISLKRPRRAIRIDGNVNAVPKFFMGEHVFAGRHFNIMAVMTIHRFCGTVRNLFDIAVAVLAVKTGVWSLA